MAFFKKTRNWCILAEWHNWYIPFYIIIAFSLASHLFYRIHDEAIASGIAKVVLFSSFMYKMNRQKNLIAFLPYIHLIREFTITVPFRTHLGMASKMKRARLLVTVIRGRRGGAGGGGEFLPRQIKPYVVKYEFQCSLMYCTVPPPPPLKGIPSICRIP